MKEKLKEKLMEEIDKFEIIDAHEHLEPEEERIKEKLDVFALFSHYTKWDLFRAGMKPEEYERLFDRTVPIEERWKIFSPFWEKIKYTCYSRSVLHTVKEFYGYSDINEGNYREISEKIQARNKKGIYREVLREKCKIRFSLTQCARTDVDSGEDPILIPVMPLTFIPEELTYEDFQKNPWAEKYVKFPVVDIDDFMEKEKIYLKKIKNEGAVGVKTRAYPHLFPFGKPDREEAEKVFKQLKEGKIERTHRVNALYYYLLDKSISFAIEENLVIAVHTGYWGDFRYLSPLHLIPFLQKYPDGKFDVYHFGYPWIRETIMLAKEFSNVYLNFCWLHIISQKAAKEALDEVIEMIPLNKIIGFGGDYMTSAVEKVYGHLKMAKEDIAEVISERIEKGWFGFEEGVEIARKFLYENPRNLYNL